MKPKMTREHAVLLIAESLVEPRYPDDPMKEASAILKRLENRLKSYNKEIKWEIEDEDPNDPNYCGAV